MLLHKRSASYYLYFCSVEQLRATLLHEDQTTSYLSRATAYWASHKLSRSQGSCWSSLDSCLCHSVPDLTSVMSSGSLNNKCCVVKDPPWVLIIAIAEVSGCQAQGGWLGLLGSPLDDFSLIPQQINQAKTYKTFFYISLTPFNMHGPALVVCILSKYCSFYVIFQKSLWKKL